jgi:pyruvate/2-oxoglutarate dehydrogenase complex dihydrolipoamide acyltransferase (E2) component
VSRSANAVEVTMPDTGAGSPPRLLAWLKRPGDAVQAGEALCRVGWDGRQAEVASPASGVLQTISLSPGALAPHGCSLAIVDPGLHGFSAPAARRFGPPVADPSIRA